MLGCPVTALQCVYLTACCCSKAVTGLSVHSSGKLVLSTSRDGALRMWNLAKGRCQYKTRLADVALDVQFAPSGSSYALVHSSEIQLCDVGGAETLHLPHTTSRCAGRSRHRLWVGDHKPAELATRTVFLCMPAFFCRG